MIRRELARRVSDQRHEAGVVAMQVRRLRADMNRAARDVRIDAAYEYLGNAEDLVRGAQRAMAEAAGVLRGERKPVR